MAAVASVEKEKVAGYQKVDTFGSKVKSTIAALSGFYKNSKREVENIIKNIFNLDISVGSVSNSEARVAENAKKRMSKSSKK